MDSFDLERVVELFFGLVRGLLKDGPSKLDGFVEARVNSFRAQKPGTLKDFCTSAGRTLAREWGDGRYSEELSALLSYVIQIEYGGTHVYLCKRPADAKREAARRMNARQLQETFGISSARAYQLLNEIRRKQQKF